jgi:hypothetical protein
MFAFVLRGAHLAGDRGARISFPHVSGFRIWVEPNGGYHAPNLKTETLWMAQKYNSKRLQSTHKLLRGIKRVPKGFFGCPHRRTLFGFRLWKGFCIEPKRVLPGTKKGSSKGSPMGTAE